MRQEERPADLVARGDALARAGDFGTAEATYRRVLDAPPRDRPADRPADRPVDRALLGLGRLYVSPDNANRDYRQAHQQFDRLAREHPESPVAGEARAWRDLLGVVLREREETTRAVLREREEAARARQETDRLRRELQQARQQAEAIRRDLERGRQEAEAIRQDLERLKRLELELERRRR
jgi:tetratricopeptide (TPR) repeat protein